MHCSVHPNPDVMNGSGYVRLDHTGWGANRVIAQDLEVPSVPINITMYSDFSVTSKGVRLYYNVDYSSSEGESTVKCEYKYHTESRLPVFNCRISLYCIVLFAQLLLRYIYEVPKWNLMLNLKIFSNIRNSFSNIKKYGSIF